MMEQPDGYRRPLAPMTNSPDTDQLRQRVLDELALVQGRIALATRLEGQAAKQQLRLAHSSQRDARLVEAAEFILGREEELLAHFADGTDVEPGAIDPVIVPVRTPTEVDLFRYATLQWSVPVSAGYGRRSRFLVRDRTNSKLIAIFALGDPVIAQAARDSVIGWNTRQRNARLYNVYDAYILGAVEPYRQLLGGKLVALLTLSNETRGHLVRKYSGNTTEIRGEQKNPTPVLITTSSALGRSSVYNRVTYRGSLMFHSVGFTKGFGHFQFSDALFADLREFVRLHAEANEGEAGRHQSNRYGKGPNWRFRVIRNALQVLGIDEAHLQHNVRREVFLAPTASGWDAFLRGETDAVDPYDLPAGEIADYYRDRWAVGRADRKPAFKFWTREEGRLAPLLPGRPLQLAVGRVPSVLPGRVELGRYDLAIGVGKTTLSGVAPSGQRAEGVAYLSRLRGEGIDITIADVEWANGERDIRGWSRHDSPEIFDQVIGRLRIGVHPADRYRGMAVMEMRPAVPKRDGLAAAKRTTISELSELLGFDVDRALDGIAGATVGTREMLLRDGGPRRRQLCVVFSSGDRVVPALVWSLVRVLALALQLEPPATVPTPPVVRRGAPRPTDLNAADE